MKHLRAPLLCGLACAVLGTASPALAQTAAAPAPSTDMAMPDDLGAPLDTPAALPAPPAGGALSVQSPIAQIASSPQGRAVLERNLPGMLERPEYMMFKGMSLAKLASLSHGRISEAKLDRIQGQLAGMRVASSTAHPHSIFTLGGQAVGRATKAAYIRGGQAVGAATKAVYTRGGQAVGAATKAVYHRVVLMIASL